MTNDPKNPSRTTSYAKDLDLSKARSIKEEHLRHAAAQDKTIQKLQGQKTQAAPQKTQAAPHASSSQQQAKDAHLKKLNDQAKARIAQQKTPDRDRSK